MYVSRKTTDRSDLTLTGRPYSSGRAAGSYALVDALASPNLVNEFDQEKGIFWTRMRPEDGRGCFTLPMLREMAELATKMPAFHAGQAAVGNTVPSYFVSASSIPGTYNLGGDLALFAEHIRTGNREMVETYAHACIDVVYANSRAFNLPLVTIGLIQGDALCGGLECALSYDVIVAERSAKVGFPEALFNLFPGMGAYSFLSRRIGRAGAERLIMSGKTYSAEEAFRDGVIDVLAEDGQGVAEVERYIHRASKRMNMQRAVYQARRRVEQVTESELRDVVNIWTDAAMLLGPNDLRMMDRLASAQRRRLATAVAAAEVSA